MMLMLNLNAEG